MCFESCQVNLLPTCAFVVKCSNFHNTDTFYLTDHGTTHQLTLQINMISHQRMPWKPCLLGALLVTLMCRSEAACMTYPNLERACVLDFHQCIPTACACVTQGTFPLTCSRDGSGAISNSPSRCSKITNCTWLIASRAIISLSFTSLNTSGSDQVIVNKCKSWACDTVQTVARLSGKSVDLSTYESDTGVLQVRLESGSSGSGFGFNATWRTSWLARSLVTVNDTKYSPFKTGNCDSDPIPSCTAKTAQSAQRCAKENGCSWQSDDSFNSCADANGAQCKAIYLAGSSKQVLCEKNLCGNNTTEKGTNSSKQGIFSVLGIDFMSGALAIIPAFQEMFKCYEMRKWSEKKISELAKSWCEKQSILWDCPCYGQSEARKFDYRRSSLNTAVMLITLSFAKTIAPQASGVNAALTNGILTVMGFPFELYDWYMSHIKSKDDPPATRNNLYCKISEIIVTLGFLMYDTLQSEMSSGLVVIMVVAGFLLSLFILGLDAFSLKRTYDISSGGGIHPELDDPLPPQLQMRPGGVPPTPIRAWE